MDTNSIIAAIDAELERLQKARVLLSSINRAAPPTEKPASRRKLGAKARKAIADAQRKRWAKVRAAKKPAKTAPTKKAAKKPTAKKPAKAAKKPTAKKSASQPAATASQ